jgi:hypothetical protein
VRSVATSAPNPLGASRWLTDAVAPSIASFDPAPRMAALDPASGPTAPFAALADVSLPPARLRVRWSPQAPPVRVARMIGTLAAPSSRPRTRSASQRAHLARGHPVGGRSPLPRISPQVPARSGGPHPRADDSRIV